MAQLLSGENDLVDSLPANPFAAKVSSLRPGVKLEVPGGRTSQEWSTGRSAVVSDALPEQSALMRMWSRSPSSEIPPARHGAAQCGGERLTEWISQDLVRQSRR